MGLDVLQLFSQLEAPLRLEDEKGRGEAVGQHGAWRDDRAADGPPRGVAAGAVNKVMVPSGGVEEALVAARGGHCQVAEHDGLYRSLLSFGVTDSNLPGAALFAAHGSNVAAGVDKGSGHAVGPHGFRGPIHNVALGDAVQSYLRPGPQAYLARREGDFVPAGEGQLLLNRGPLRIAGSGAGPAAHLQQGKNGDVKSLIAQAVEHSGLLQDSVQLRGHIPQHLVLIEAADEARAVVAIEYREQVLHGGKGSIPGLSGLFLGRVQDGDTDQGAHKGLGPGDPAQGLLSGSGSGTENDGGGHEANSSQTGSLQPLPAIHCGSDSHELSPLDYRFTPIVDLIWIDTFLCPICQGRRRQGSLCFASL